MAESRTYQGASLEELLPQIRADLGAGAVITRRREGVTGGFAGFFGKRCVEVEAQAGGPVSAIPARDVFDAYDSSREPADDDGGPVMRSLIQQASPFADALDEALAQGDIVESPAERIRGSRPGVDERHGRGLCTARSRRGLGRGRRGARERRDAGGGRRVPRHRRRQDARPVRPRSDTDRARPQDAGADDAGRARLAHEEPHDRPGRAGGVGQDPDRGQARARIRPSLALQVRTVSLEPGEGSNRLDAMTEGLDIERRSADTPDAAKASVRARGELPLWPAGGAAAWSAQGGRFSGDELRSDDRSRSAVAGGTRSGCCHCPGLRSGRPSRHVFVR